MRRSGRIDITAMALEAIHHGGGTLGNTQLLRMQEVVLKDGSVGRVPYISGNSFKHLIRDGAARFALEAMGVGDGQLTKPVVDLLFSGGHLTKGGAAVDMTTARQLADLFPMLSLCGYSAGNMMVGSRINVDNLHLVCSENHWRVPGELTILRHVDKPAGNYLAEEFGTRHEALRQPHVAQLLLFEERAAEDAKRSDTARKKTPAKVEGSSQMIFDFQVIRPGAMLWGGITFTELSPGELLALRSGLSRACQGAHHDGGFLFRLGAKGSVGLGLVSMRFRGALRAVETPAFEESDALLPAIAGDDGLESYAAGLRERREEILELLAQAVA
jgi:hypothetical protein